MLYKSKIKGSFGRIYPISMVIIYILCMIEIYIRWNLNNSGYGIYKDGNENRIITELKTAR